MKTVKQILKTKERAVWSIQPGASIFDALKIMAEKEVGALVVMDGEKLVGIFSERDYARKVILRGKSSQETPISDIMTRTVIYVNPTQTIEECMALMTGKHIRHLPVLEGGQLVGIVSIGDLVRMIIDDQQFLIEQLVRYIRS